MSTIPDWEQARRDLLEEGRKRVGPPPDAEKVEALLRGELPEDEAERVRRVLAYYPELVHVMTAAASDDSSAGLTESEREADLARVRERLGLAQSIPWPSMRNRTRMLAWAAGIVFAIAVGSVVMTRLRTPDHRRMATKIIIADEERAMRGRAGTPEIHLSAETDYLLKPLFRPSQRYRKYRLVLADLNGSAPIFIRVYGGIERQPDGSFPLPLSTRELETGRYRFILYGVDGSEKLLATYTFRVDTP